MIVINVWVESGCSFDDGEFSMYLSAVVNDALDIRNDIDRIEECIREYDKEIKEEITYTFFLHRANIATAFPGYEPAFDISTVIENIEDINIQL